VVTVFVIVIIESEARTEIPLLKKLLNRVGFRLLLVEYSCGMLIIDVLNASDLMSAISVHYEGLSLVVLACRLLPRGSLVAVFAFLLGHYRLPVLSRRTFVHYHFLVHLRILKHSNLASIYYTWTGQH